MLRAVAALLLALAFAGCGVGAGESRDGGAEVRVTRDFGRVDLGAASEERVSEGQTVMRLLRSNFDVKTRFGGRFVQSIDGLEGGGAGGTSDWFYFVNGLEAGVGAAEYELSPADRVQWDHRDWRATMRVPAIVGAFPEPLANGAEGRRRPVRVECEKQLDDVCRTARKKLTSAGVRVSGSSLGAPGTDNVIRVVVARWPAARIVRGLVELEKGPAASGVFARFGRGGRSLELLDERGQVARRVAPGAGTGIVAALRRTEEEIVWLVTGLDRRGVASAAGALEEKRLRGAFAAAVSGRTTEKLPLQEQ